MYGKKKLDNFDSHIFHLTPRSAANLERSGKFVRQQRLVMPHR
jgi:hypothetical protein